MKFLCPSCKAKYQIADEKVSGKTLKMVCRQCGDEIVIRGDGTRRAAAPTPDGGGGGGGGLSAGFQQHVSTGNTSVSEVAEYWHVAINDIPVGPMRRDEVGRKMAVGAVGLESLAWREGLDDWLPVRQIPELMGLWQTSQAAGLSVSQVAAGAGAGGPPGPVDRAAMAPVAPSTQLPASEIGDGYGSSPNLQTGGPLSTLSSVPPPSEAAISQGSQLSPILHPPFPQVEAGGSKSTLGWGPMFLLVCGGAFILAVGALLGAHMLAPSPQQAVPVPVPVAPAAEEPPKAQEPAEVEADPEEELIVLEPEDIAGQTAVASRKSAPKKGAATGRTGTAGKVANLTDEQREMLERMGGSNFGDPGALARPSSTAPQASGNTGQSLTAAQLASVVNKGKRSLQRCYETALRGSGSTDTVRLDVEITVSPNGNVTSVKTKGQSLPGMDKCISSTARTWRFPKAGASTTTQFPILFQPGA